MRYEWFIWSLAALYALEALFFFLVVNSVCKMLVIPRTEKNLESEEIFFCFRVSFWISILQYRASAQEDQM